jgi:hypothetical protein
MHYSTSTWINCVKNGFCRCMTHVNVNMSNGCAMKWYRCARIRAKHAAAPTLFNKAFLLTAYVASNGKGIMLRFQSSIFRKWNIQIHTFTCCFLWVSNSIPHLEAETPIDVRENGSKDNISNKYWRRSQSLRDLKNEMSSLALTLGSWVRIPLKVWMPVCVYSVFVLSCVGSDLETGRSSVQGVPPIRYQIRSFRLILNWNRPQSLIRKEQGQK